MRSAPFSQVCGGSSYDWISDPNEGYGLGSSTGLDLSAQDHQTQIRHFPSMIDPLTDYIADD